MYTEHVKRGMQPRKLEVSRGLRKELQGAEGGPRRAGGKLSESSAKLSVVVIITISMITIINYPNYKIITN